MIASESRLVVSDQNTAQIVPMSFKKPLIILALTKNDEFGKQNKFFSFSKIFRTRYVKPKIYFLNLVTNYHESDTIS